MAKLQVVQAEHQNSMVENPLILPLVVLPNTPDEEIRRNIRINSALDLEWLNTVQEHDGVAVLVGGGASIEDEVRQIQILQCYGATVFAMNAASKWCCKHGIGVDYQCILDAKEETISLVDYGAKAYLFGSQVNPKVMRAVETPIVWHCNTDNDIEKDFPLERIKQGGYVLASGGSAVGNSSMTAIYALGFRNFHIFGFDSCHRDGKSHAYDQPMNKHIPNVEVTWGGETYTASVAMKGHAEDFQVMSQALKQLGCEFTVYGEGLLQSMYFTTAKDMSEQEKYQTMWQYDMYRNHCPGERVIDSFLEHVKPDGIIIDYGCGTGRTSLALLDKGHDVMLLDFTDNCRDQEALSLPFIQWDLTIPIPAKADYGICTDVMEHIPPDDVETVITNIMDSAESVFFQISTVEDSFGEYVDADLHLSIHPHARWHSIISSIATIVWEQDLGEVSLFHVKHINKFNNDCRETAQQRSI